MFAERGRETAREEDRPRESARDGDRKTGRREAEGSAVLRPELGDLEKVERIRRLGLTRIHYRVLNG